MDLIQVNIVYSQAREAGIYSGQDVLAAQTDVIGASTHTETHFGGNHKIFAILSFEPMSKDRF